MNENIKIKISEITSKKENIVSKFSIAYSSRKIDNSFASYEIISALKADDNIIIEVNSSLLNLSQQQNQSLVDELVDSLEKMGIKYKNKKIKVDAKLSILSIAMQSKKTDGFELYAYIPHEIWCDQNFRKVIPNIGVRYYIPKLNTENNLDAFVDLDEDEKFELCRMVIYDHIILASMGINTSIYKKKDLIEILHK